MINIKAIVQYDGSSYSGWARQKTNHNTIQEKIEDTLQLIFKKKIKIEGSGRTDAYVHALGQVFSFKIDNIKFNVKKLSKILNDKLPSNIKIIKACECDPKFHARFSVKEKIYLYKINTGKFDLFNNNYIFNYNHKLNLAKMKQAAKILVGQHNFLSFSTSEIIETIRTINYIKISKTKDIVKVLVSGNGFLRNMVRMIVGSLIDVSENKKSLTDIKKLLEVNKKGSSITKLPGCGLYLYKVKY